MKQNADGPLHSYRDLALFIGLAAPAVVGTALAVYTAMSSSPLRSLSQPIRLVVPQMAGYAAAIGVLALQVRSRGEDILPALRWKIPAGMGIHCVSLGGAIAVGNVLVATLLRVPTIDSPMQRLMLEDPITMAVAAVTMAPVCEEILFRGILQPVVVRDTGFAGVILVALPFALLHGPEYGWSWQHIMLITAAGASFGAIRYHTNSTGAAALAHASYNGLLMLAYLFGRILA